MATNADRFLDAFNGIEDELARRHKSTSYVPFGELLRTSKDLTDSQKELLRRYANLRNVIVHTPSKGAETVIADPRDDVVRDIEAQLEYLVRPPRVLTVLKRNPPLVLDADKSVVTFLAEVALPKNYSQSPVRLSDGSLALITTNAVARWIAEAYEPGGLAIDDASIAHVLGYAEEGDAIRMSSRNLTAVQAWRIFSGSDGIAPAAIVITNSGRSSEAPLGLVVKADVPELLRALGV